MLKLILTFFVFVFIYLILARVLPKIGVAQETNNERKEISIYMLSNGVHTDLVLPIRYRELDWSKQIRFENTRKRERDFEYIAFGWGDKGFYLETPTWDDLTFSTAFKAAFGLSSSAIHTTFYKEVDKDPENCIEIKLGEKQYRRLVSYIKKSFKSSGSDQFYFIPTTAVYGNNDAFYEANGNYNLFSTCNSWTNNGLKSCGQKACIWTPFQEGIFDQYTD